MKALTLYQPWASLIAVGAKTIETRGYRPPSTLKLGERFAIHAGKTRVPVGRAPELYEPMAAKWGGHMLEHVLPTRARSYAPPSLWAGARFS